MSEIAAKALQAKPLQGKPKTLTQLRLNRGMTLADVGDKLGLSVSMVSRLERADRRLNLEVAAKLAQVYETNLDEIFRLYSSSRLFSKK